MINDTDITGNVALPLPIPQPVRQIASHLASQQATSQKASQVRLNTIAVCGERLFTDARKCYRTIY